MDPLQQSKIDALYSRAAIARQNGQNDVATRIYRKILSLAPESGDAHYFLGRKELENGSARQSLRYFQTARTLDKSNPDYWVAFADTLIALKDEKSLRSLVADAKMSGLSQQTMTLIGIKIQTGNRGGIARLNPNLRPDFARLVTVYESGDYKSTERRALTLLETYPNAAPVYAVLGASRAALGKPDQARDSYENALKRDPNYFDANLQLGQLLLQLGLNAEASAYLQKSYDLAPLSPVAQKFLGIWCACSKLPNRAIPLLQKAGKQMAGDTDLLLALCAAHLDEHARTEAIAVFKAVKISSLRTAEQHKRYGDLCEVLNKNSQAIGAFKAALDLAPGNNQIVRALINLYQIDGNFDQARQLAMQAIDLGVKDGALFYIYSNLGKVRPDDPVIDRMIDLLDKKQADPVGNASLAYGLSKSMADIGKPDKSFHYLAKANDALKKSYPIGEDNYWTNMKRSQSAFAREADVGRRYPQQKSDLKPQVFFVTGMPRSGTTLVEQIISSHSEVNAGGEIGLPNRLLAPLVDIADVDGSTIGEADLNSVGAAMTKTYSQLSQGARFITDKAIFTFGYSGWMKYALPGSRMIIVRRDPRDNCLSMYRNFFNPGFHRYTTDLRALGRVYLRYLDILAFWRTNFPEAFCEIRYEDVIGEPEKSARKLIKFCGLEWQDSCLEFYNNSRKVRTLSNVQVRQPIYSSSVGAWKNYEKELAPLIEILEQGGALDEYGG